MEIPTIQKERIIEYIKQGKRFDGRKFNEFREIVSEIGISENAEGSCSIKIGKTEVYAGVKMSVSTPYPDSPKKGNLSVTLELGAMADSDFDLGAPGIGAIEMARVIDRGIRESGIIDWEKLCIAEDEAVWQINLDIYAINNDGNLFDAAALAGLLALYSAKFPKYNEETKRIEHELTDIKIPLIKENMSFNLTVHKIGNEILIDPSLEEEKVSEYRLGIAIANNNGEPRITAMQKGKEGSITEEDMENVLKFVEDNFKELSKKITDIVSQ